MLGVICPSVAGKRAMAFRSEGDCFPQTLRNLLALQANIYLLPYFLRDIIPKLNHLSGIVPFSKSLLHNRPRLTVSLDI